MQFVSPIFDLYTDYLIVNQGQNTSTGLSALLEGKMKHDSITRSLSERDYTSRDLWLTVKPFVREMESSEGVFILDDTVEEKAYMDENDMICWHRDHCQNRNLKGINQLTALYHSKEISLPVGYEIIHKTKWIKDSKTQKEKRISPISKQELFRKLIRQSIENGLVFKYILADSWFSAAENMTFIAQKERYFIIPLKSNRKIALTEENKIQGNYQSIESLVLEDNQTLQVYVETVDFPLSITKQVFQNKDGSVGVIYLSTNDLTIDADQIKTTYSKRWKVEEFYKSVKSNTGYAKSPAHTVRTQTNHLFLSMLAFVKLEALKISTKMNRSGEPSFCYQGFIIIKCFKSRLE